MALILSCDRIVVCGPSGSGKTRILQHYLTTHLAGECVVHRVQGIGPMHSPAYTLCLVRDMVEEVPLMVIDDVQEWSGASFDALDGCLRVKSGRVSLPFGGTKLICAGDLMKTTRASDAVFRSRAWSSLRPAVLRRVFGVPADHWIQRFMRRARRDALEEEDILPFRRAPDKNSITIVDGTRVSQLNATHCRDGGARRSYKALTWSVYGDAWIVDRVCREKRVPLTLDVRVSAVVYTTRSYRSSDGFERPFIRGAVERLGKDEIHMRCFADGRLHVITRVFYKHYTRKSSSVCIGWVKQFPLALGWFTDDATVALRCGDGVTARDRIENAYALCCAFRRFACPTLRLDHFKPTAGVIECIRGMECGGPDDQWSGMDTVLSMDSHLQADADAE